jgi:hypothetical protein
MSSTEGTTMTGVDNQILEQLRSRQKNRVIKAIIKINEQIKTMQSRVENDQYCTTHIGDLANELAEALGGFNALAEALESCR